MRSFQLVEVNVNRLGLVGVEKEKERVVEGCRQDKRKRGEIWPLWVSAEREREREGGMAHGRKEREKRVHVSG